MGDLQDKHPDNVYSELRKFYNSFSDFHDIGGFAICISGVLLCVGLLNVLRSRKLRGPFNFLLTAMAISDVLTMTPYASFFILALVLGEYPQQSYGWTLLRVIVACLTSTLHVASTWLEVTLSSMRLAQISMSTESKAKTNWKILAKIGLFFALLLSVVSHFPVYLFTEMRVHVAANRTVSESFGLGIGNSNVVVGFCVYAVVGKILPCALILAVGGPAVYYMTVKMKHSQHVLPCRRIRWRTASTVILASIISLTVMSELPKGILVLLSLNNDYYASIHHYTGQLQDFVTLLVSCINLTLYCVMGQGFRREFTETYCRSRSCRRRMTNNFVVKYINK